MRTVWRSDAKLVRTHVAYLRWLSSGSRRSSSRYRPVVKAEDAIASIPATSASVACAEPDVMRGVPTASNRSNRGP